MQCNKCGFNNYDGATTCCNCHANLLKQKGKKIKTKNKKNNQPQMNYNNGYNNGMNNYQSVQYMQQNDYMAQKQVLVDPNIKVPKKKFNWKPVFTTLFILILLGITIFCIMVYIESNKKAMEDKQMLSEIPLEQEVQLEDPSVIDRETEQADILIPKDTFVTPTIQPTTKVENSNEENVSSETIQEQPINQNEIETLKKELFGEEEIALYQPNSLFNMTIPKNHSQGSSLIYGKNGVTFWNGTVVSAHVASISNRNILTTIFNEKIENHIETWGFPEKKNNILSTSLNNSFAYYINGYNQEKDMYTRVFFITGEPAMTNSDGTIGRVAEKDETDMVINTYSEYIVLEISYPSSDATKATKLIKLLNMEYSSDYFVK